MSLALANLGGLTNLATQKPNVGSYSAAQPSDAQVLDASTTTPQQVGTTYTADQLAQQQANAYTDLQLASLRDLLGRTDTGLNQGLQQIGDTYTGSVNQQQNQENQALQDYADKRVTTNKDKLGAYDTINKNANNGYRSLSQIVGRSAGTGSSAFQDLLPDVIGKDISGKRTDANTTYAQNLGNIDTAQKKTELSFQQVLQDLATQRAAQEQQLRTGVEGQKQNLLGQEQQLLAQRGNLAGAQAIQPQIESSRSAVENFFNQFRPTITPQQAAVAAPDLSQYTVDRSTVNAQQQGVPDTTNPYADILRKKLQDQTV